MDLKFGSVNFAKIRKNYTTITFKKVSKQIGQFTFGIRSSSDVTKRASVKLLNFNSQNKIPKTQQTLLQLNQYETAP